MSLVIRIAAAALLLALVTTGCRARPAPTATPATEPTITPQPAPTAAPTPEATATSQTEATSAIPTIGSYTEFAGTWRIYSARLFYDEGGGGDVGDAVPSRLELTADGTWQFGPSSGSFAVEAIQPEDWVRWEVEAYGPTRKIILYGWNSATADGPIEESEGRIDFLWVIYRAVPPTVSAAGTVWLKFGHP